jgi:hypothetical protein
MPLTCDVLVVGGGSAGAPAAIAAARAGAATILVEAADFLGGCGAVAPHQALCGLYASTVRAPRTTLNVGLAREIALRLQAAAPGRRNVRSGRVWVLPFDPQRWKDVLRQFTLGVPHLQVMLGTCAESVERQADRVTSVCVRRQRRRLTIAPKIVIDCTGVGAIIRACGIPYSLEPAATRQMAGFVARLENIAASAELLPLAIAYRLAEAARSGHLPLFLRFTTFMPGPAKNSGYLKLSIPAALPDRDRQALAATRRTIDYLRQTMPQCSAVKIAGVSPQALDREGLRLRGRYCLTAEDILAARKFKDAAAKNAWPMEIWDPKRGPQYRYLPSRRYYEIPLRCCRSADLANLLAAGRCMSADHEALGSTRVMGACMAVGASVGAAAARLARKIADA